jgi:flagellar motor switch protein FliN/FliY
MDPRLESAKSWFFECLTSRMAAVFEAMTGVRPYIGCAAGAAPETGGLRWRQPFRGAPGAAWIEASEKHWMEAANQILRAAGIEDADGPTMRSTYAEILGQTLAGVAQDFSSRLGREIVCSDGGESQGPPGDTHWARLSIRFEGQFAGTAEMTAAIEENLLQALLPVEAALKAATGAEEDPAATAKTFDLLLDVELPVSVSFGRAKVALKDVIKLTTGAIVELNRSISEPVEVIVNNCVIARGEVVVVEGNFGVRIQEVISRQERLRTLN